MSSTAATSSSVTSASSSRSAPETARERNNRIVKDLADRVVKGWTLLNSTCPTCQTALLRSRDSTVYCVGCRMPVVTEAEARQRNLISPAATSDLQASAPPAPPSISTSPSVLPSTPDMPSPALPPSRASSFAAPAGDGSANGPPRNGLASLSSHSRFAEIEAQLRDLNGHQREEAESSNASQAEERSSAPAAQEEGGGTAARVQRQQARTNNLSAKLGEKMMQGWTLMGVHCADDSCLVPLPLTHQRLCPPPRRVVRRV